MTKTLGSCDLMATTLSVAGCLGGLLISGPWSAEAHCMEALSLTSTALVCYDHHHSAGAASYTTLPQPDTVCGSMKRIMATDLL